MTVERFVLGIAILGTAAVGGAAATTAYAGVVVGIVMALITSWWLSSRPKQALYVWLGVLCLTPVWITVQVGPFQLQPGTLAALLVLPSCLGRPPDAGGWRRGDSWMALIVALTAAVVFLSNPPTYVLSALLLQGVTAYFVARRLGARVGVTVAQRAVAHLTVIVALWALVEFALGLHVFSGLVWSPDLSFWNAVQERGAFDRSEAAWGHAIALGAWLALGLPFVMLAGLRRAGLCIALVMAAALTTLSRGPILGCLLAFAMVVLFSRRLSSTRRTVWTLGLLAVAIAAVPAALAAIGQVQGELDTTAGYRTLLLKHAADDLNWFSLADNVTFIDGMMRYRGFGSIDNAFLLMALQAGLLVTGAYAVALLACLLRVLRRRGSAADMAMGAQILVLATVAMITQYEAAVYFMAGLAVATAVPRGEAGAEDEVSDAPPLRQAVAHARP